MTRIVNARGPLGALLISMVLMPLPAVAQETEEAPSLMEEGARLFFRGLMSEMEPTLNDMGSALDEIGPALREMGPQLRELVRLMGDVRHYSMPERLANGDILIRRNADAPPAPGLEATPDFDLVPDPPPERPETLPHQLPWPPRPGPNGEIEL